jgi:hypothetical protein
LAYKAKIIINKVRKGYISSKQSHSEDNKADYDIACDCSFNHSGVSKVAGIAKLGHPEDFLKDAAKEVRQTIKL